LHYQTSNGNGAMYIKNTHRRFTSLNFCSNEMQQQIKN
jgi:hypothetical protein